MRVTSDPVYIPFLQTQLALDELARAQCIVCVDDGVPVAGAVYAGYNTVSVDVHIWIEEGRVPCRDWYVAIFDYPFNHLNIHKGVGRVVAKNTDAIKLDEHFGFVLEATIKDYSPMGDLYLYTMTREQCRVLNSPLWAKAVARVSAVIRGEAAHGR